MSRFAIDSSRSSSSMICTVSVSSLRRRPRMVLPSFVTIVTGRLIGSIADEGSRSDRSSAAGARATPMSLRSGAARGPRPFTRWQVPHVPLPSKIARPRAASPTRTDAVVSKLARMKATMPVSSDGCSLNGRHARGRSARDDPGEILVGGRAAEQAAAKIDAGNLVAVPAVALAALRAVDAVARGDVFLAVLSGVILVQQLLRAGRDGHRDETSKRPARPISNAGNGIGTLYTSPAAKSTRALSSLEAPRGR